MKDRSISMDISNIPKQVKHNITFVLLNKSNKILSTATRESWLLDTWLDIAAKEDDVLCSDNQCDLQSNNFAAPFYASVAGVFNKDEMNAILQFTKLNRKLYTDTTVGEVEKVDGKYRRTKKIIVPPKQGVISMIYNRLEKVAKVLNQRYWRFRLGNSSSLSLLSPPSSPPSSFSSSSSCRLHEHMQFLLYSSNENGFYDWHLDRGLSGSSSLRKLSMTVQLTEASDYNGGYLDIMTGRNHTSMPKTKGVVSIFPSYMLHRVSPVTNGERESIVLWFTGCEGYQ